MAVVYPSIFSQIYSGDNTIKRDVLRDLRLGKGDDRGSQIMDSALMPSNEHQKRHAAILEQVYIDFLRPNHPGRLKAYGWGEKGDDGEYKPGTIDKCIEAYMDMFMADSLSKQIKNLPEELQKQLRQDISGLARVVSNARDSVKKQAKENKKRITSGKAYKQLIEIENLMQSIEKEDSALLKTKGYKRITKEIDRLYKKEPLTLRDVGLLVYRIHINRSRLFSRKGQPDAKFKKVSWSELRERFSKFIQPGFTDNTNSELFKKSADFEKFKTIREQVRSDVAQLKIKTQPVHVAKKIRLRAQKVADAFGESRPSFSFGRGLRKKAAHEKPEELTPAQAPARPTPKDANKLK